MGPCEKSRGEERGEPSKERQPRGKKEQETSISKMVWLYIEEKQGEGEESLE